MYQGLGSLAQMQGMAGVWPEPAAAAAGALGVTAAQAQQLQQLQLQQYLRTVRLAAFVVAVVHCSLLSGVLCSGLLCSGSDQKRWRHRVSLSCLRLRRYCEASQPPQPTAARRRCLRAVTRPATCSER